MAALTATVSPIQSIQHERFTTEQHGYNLSDLSLSSSGNIAVCGRHGSSRRTFIDLYFGRNSDSRDKLKLFYSKEFEKYSHYWLRRISFFENGSQIVSCIGDKIEIIDPKNESKVLRSCRVNGKIWCVAVREGEIFIGLAGSQTLIVFNNDLKETKKINLKGIQDGDYPYDLQVIKDTVFVRTAGRYGKVYTINERDGRVISTFTNITGKYRGAWSLAVSESLGLVAVVWDWHRIIVYSLNENKPFLVFHDNSNNDSNDVFRIRISDRDRMLITGNSRTGEIKMYDLDQLFTFEAMKRTLAYTVTLDECEKLRKYFEVSEDELSQELVGDAESEKEETIKRMECLLAVIEKKGHLNPYNINAFKHAVAAIGDEMHSTNLQGPVEGYILHGILRSKVKYEDLAAEMMARQKSWEDEKNHLNDALRTAKAKENEYEKTINNKEGELKKMKNQSEEQEKSLKSQLEKTKQSLESSRVELQQTRTTLTKELTQTQTESAKTADRLTEELVESAKKLEAVIKELNDTHQSLDLSRRQSAKQIEILISELEQTRAESAKQIEALTAEFEQTRTDSAKEMEVVKEELKETKKSLELSRAELDQTRTTSAKTIKTLTKELTLTQTESGKQMEIVKEELKETRQSLELSRVESTKQLDALELQLNQFKQKLNSNIKEKETLHRDLEITKQVLDQTKQDRDGTRIELEKYQLEFAKESKALSEVLLNQTKGAKAGLQKGAMEDKPSDDPEGARGGDFTYLVAEFGRLAVSVAEYLTLDDCLKLATLFDVSPAGCDILRRVSLIESPGIKFLDILKQREFINMFDVTNLQKAFAMLELEALNQNVVVPYQEKIDEEHYEMYKVEEIFTWDAVCTFLNPVKDGTVRCQIREIQMQQEDDTEHNNTSQFKMKASQLEAGLEDRRSHLRESHHQFYTECNIGRQGGTIHTANVSLTIPPNALHESHVIALAVINESPFPLDREVDTARLTPLIKLQPLGLTFNKSLQLNIPHSALIPEPEKHDVIIYSGQISKSERDSSDYIQWTTERSVPRQLKEKSVTIDIQCLSYLSASLVSQTMSPTLFILRAAAFVDGVRNADDDVTVTICFCSDNDAEYNMLLSDYKTKLPLEQYSTVQLHRHSESDEDDAGFLSMTVSSVNNSYVPHAEQPVKKFAVSHLCTASRVPHQLRLKKNQSTDRDVVDIELTFSQAQYEPTKISLKTRKKDLIISEESEALLTGSLPSGINEMYTNLVVKISSSLGKKQCRELAAHFQLTSEETEMITSNQDPGEMLMKTLENRSVIDSQKMILFFEGLKVCHLDEPAGLVSEYISETSRQIQEEQKHEGGENFEETEEGSGASYYLMKKAQRTHSSLNDQSVQTTLSSSYVSSDAHVQTLTSEGYTEHEVVEALDISKNRLVMARKVLQFLGEQLDVQPRTDIFLHKEQYIDENGGDIYLPKANVHIVIPTGAIPKGSIVSLTMMTNEQANVPSKGRNHQLTPVIKCGQEGLTLLKPVTIKIPHCASEIEGISSTNMYLGFSGDGGKGIRWRKRKQHEPAPVLKKDHFEVFLTQFCAIGLNNTVDTKKPFSKRRRVLPLIGRVANPSDELIITLWIYNDDETEHMHLVHGEISVGGKIQLHDFQSLTIKSLGSDKEVHIKSENNRISPKTNIKKLLSSTLWHNTRHSVEFHFQNKEGVNDVSFNLRICRKQLLRTVDELQFDLKVTLDELLQKNQESTTTLLQKQEPQPAMRKPFEELISKLSGQLSMDSCLEIAGMFGLPADFLSRMKESREPGVVLFDELIHEQLITAASVSALDVALSKTGNIHLAEHVKEYRMRNVTFPTTIFTLL